MRSAILGSQLSGFEVETKIKNNNNDKCLRSTKGPFRKQETGKQEELVSISTKDIVTEEGSLILGYRMGEGGRLMK